MSPRTYEAASLSEIIHKNHVVALVERGVPARLALEFEGDTALFQGRYRDALASYRAARGASWRVRAKMGWCCFHLKQWEAGARFLGEAARRGETLPLLALIRCLAGKNSRAGEWDEEIDRLVRALLALPDPVPHFYELADAHVIDPVLRLQALRKGWESFPAEVALRRRYTLALWAAGAPEADVCTLVREAVAPVDAAPEDLWQGYEILLSFARHPEGLALVHRLASTSGRPDRLALALVEADVQVLAGDLDRAAAGLQALVASLNLDDDHEREVALHATKALLQERRQRWDQIDLEHLTKPPWRRCIVSPY
jgi:tetratricopeptide (TPR) repeat protein